MRVSKLFVVFLFFIFFSFAYKTDFLRAYLSLHNKEGTLFITNIDYYKHLSYILPDKIKYDLVVIGKKFTNEVKVYRLTPYNQALVFYYPLDFMENVGVFVNENKVKVDFICKVYEDVVVLDLYKKLYNYRKYIKTIRLKKSFEQFSRFSLILDNDSFYEIWCKLKNRSVIALRFKTL